MHLRVNLSLPIKKCHFSNKVRRCYICKSL